MATSKVQRAIFGMANSLAKLFELLLSIILLVIVFPILLFTWILNELIRLIISIIFYLQQLLNSSAPKFNLISEGSDGIWAYKKSGNSRNILILYIYNGSLNLQKFRQNYMDCVINYIDPKNGYKPYNKFLNIFKQKYGYFVWETHQNFQIQNHIRYLSENTMECLLTETQVFEYMSTLTGDMDDSQPQWEEILVPNFIYDADQGQCSIQRCARIYRGHHAYMDGCSSLLMSAACMGDRKGQFPFVLNPTAPIQISKWKQIFYKITCVLFGLTTVIKTLYDASKIQSRYIMKDYSGRQKFTWSTSLDLKIIRKIKEKSGTSVPAILSAATIGALKNLETKTAKEGQRPLTLGIVGAILPYPNIYPKNRFTVANFSPTTSNSTKLEYLLKIQGDLRKLTQSPVGLVTYTVFEVLGRFPTFVIQSLLDGARTPVIYSNVPWASDIVRLWNLEVNDVAGWMPLLTSAGLGLLSVTYNNQVRLCLIYDETCMTQDEVKYLLTQVQIELRLLAEEAESIPQVKASRIHCIV